MFVHAKAPVFRARPERADAAAATRLQELLAGRTSVMTGAMQCFMQAWNCRAPSKYRHLLLDIGTEKLGHVEALALAIAELLHGAAPDPAAEARAGAPAPFYPAPYQLLHAGLGPTLADAAGRPWAADPVVATGNLLADLRADVALDTALRLHAARLYNLTADPGVRDLLGFLIARCGAHQNQWLAAIEELYADGLEEVTAPGAFPAEHENSQLAYRYWNLSAGGDSRAGRWARGPAPDGRGRFEYYSEFPATPPGAAAPPPTSNGRAPSAAHHGPQPPPPDPRLFLTGAHQRPAPPGGVRFTGTRRPPIGAAMRGAI